MVLVMGSSIWRVERLRRQGVFPCAGSSESPYLGGMKVHGRTMPMTGLGPSGLIGEVKTS